MTSLSSISWFLVFPRINCWVLLVNSQGLPLYHSTFFYFQREALWCPLPTFVHVVLFHGLNVTSQFVNINSLDDRHWEEATNFPTLSSYQIVCVDIDLLRVGRLILTFFFLNKFFFFWTNVNINLERKFWSREILSVWRKVTSIFHHF